MSSGITGGTIDVNDAGLSRSSSKLLLLPATGSYKVGENYSEPLFWGGSTSTLFFRDSSHAFVT